MTRYGTRRREREDVSISLFLPALHRAGILLLGVPAAAGLLTYVASSSQMDIYEATSLVRLLPPSGAGIVGADLQGPNSVREIRDQVQLLESRDFQVRVRAILGTNREDLVSLYATEIPDSNTIRIVAQAKDPTTSVDAANALAAVYITERERLRGEHFARRADALEEQAVRVAETGADRGLLSDSGLQESQRLKSLAAEYRAEADATGADVEVTESAEARPEAALPLPLRDAGLAAAISLLVTCVGVVAWASHEDRLESGGRVEALPGGPPLIGDASTPQRGPSRRLSGSRMPTPGLSGIAALLRYRSYARAQPELVLLAADDSVDIDMLASRVAESMRGMKSRVAVVLADGHGSPQIQPGAGKRNQYNFLASANDDEKKLIDEGHRGTEAPQSVPVDFVLRACAPLSEHPEYLRFAKEADLAVVVVSPRTPRRGLVAMLSQLSATSVEMAGIVVVDPSSARRRPE